MVNLLVAASSGDSFLAFCVFVECLEAIFDRVGILISARVTVRVAVRVRVRVGVRVRCISRV